MEARNYVYCSECGEEYNSYGPGHKCNPETLAILEQYGDDDQDVRDSYSITSQYENTDYPNDTLTFYVVSDADGVPVDCLRLPRQGDKYMIRGDWKPFEEAEEYARQVLGKWL